jgi:hypothetical protein
MVTKKRALCTPVTQIARLRALGDEANQPGTQK